MADAHNHASPWAVSGIAWRKVGVNIRRAAAGEELEIWVDWLQVEVLDAVHGEVIMGNAHDTAKSWRVVGVTGA